MHWASLAGSLMAIAAVVLASRWLGRREARLASDEEAMRLAGEMVPGFAAVHAVRCDAHSAALLEDGEGHFVLLKRLGSHYAARRLGPPVRARLNGERGLLVESGDRWFGRVELLLPDAAAAALWRARLVGSCAA